MKKSLIFFSIFLAIGYAGAHLEPGETMEKIVIEKQNDKEIFHIFVRKELPDGNSYEKRDFFTTELPEGYSLVQESLLGSCKRIVVSDSFLKTAKAGVTVVGAVATLSPLVLPAAALGCKEVYQEAPDVYHAVSDLVKGKRKNKVVARQSQENDQVKSDVEENKTEQKDAPANEPGYGVTAMVYDKAKQAAVVCKNAIPDVSGLYSGAHQWAFGKKEVVPPTPACQEESNNTHR